MTSYVVADLVTGTIVSASSSVVFDWESLSDSEAERVETGNASEVAEVLGDRRSVLGSVVDSERFAGLIVGAPGLVASVRTWYDRVNGNSYLAGEILEVFTGRLLPLPFQYGRDSERAVRDAVAAAGGELVDARLVIFETEVDTEQGCRHGGLVSFCRPVVGS
jgi:hypothetical protein